MCRRCPSNNRTNAFKVNEQAEVPLGDGGKTASGGLTSAQLEVGLLQGLHGHAHHIET